VTRLVCHHARCLWVTRLRREVVLKTMLTRKGGPARENLALGRELERGGVLAAAREAGVGDVMVIVVATPVVETGNDVDFDYAIVEPSSVRAIVQTAGRVVRHRDLVPAAPNVALLSTTFRGLAAGAGRAFAYPGVETPPQAPGIQAHRLPSARLDDLVAREVLEGGAIDARLVLEPDAAGPLALEERRLLGEFLDAGAFASPVGFAEAADTVRFSRAFAENRRFRRDAASERVFHVPEGLAPQPGWYRVDPRSGTSSPVRLRAATAPEPGPLAAPLLADDEITGLGLRVGRRLDLGPPMRLAQLVFGMDVEEYVLGTPVPDFDRLSYEAGVGLMKE
jgi:CRISPR-associated endonuclease/helicase Cas3